jgi:hypothetical protein
VAAEVVVGLEEVLGLGLCATDVVVVSDEEGMGETVVEDSTAVVVDELGSGLIVVDDDGMMEDEATAVVDVTNVVLLETGPGPLGITTSVTLMQYLFGSVSAVEQKISLDQHMVSIE